MNPQETLVQAHYGRADLIDSLLGALRDAGKNVDALTREDLATFEEFHIRGRDATREMARLAELREGMNVLDVGSGIGGPARTLAAEFGCRVTGIDLVQPFCTAAVELSRRIGMDGQVQFHQGDALRMPFPASSFDAVMHEHVTMNIPDKPALYREIARVLRPDGRLAVYEICAGESAPAHYPAPWAADPTISFLAPPDQLRAAVESAGFHALEWRDVSALSLEWCRTTVANIANRPKDAPPPLGLALIMGPDGPVKMKNVIRNLEEDRIRVVQGVFELAQRR